MKQQQRATKDHQSDQQRRRRRGQFFVLHIFCAICTNTHHHPLSALALNTIPASDPPLACAIRYHTVLCLILLQPYPSAHAPLMHCNPFIIFNWVSSGFSNLSSKVFPLFFFGLFFCFFARSASCTSIKASLIFHAFVP